MTGAVKNEQLRLLNSKVDQMNFNNQNGRQLESCNPLILNRILAERTGLEPATPGVIGRYQNSMVVRIFRGFSIPIFPDLGLRFTRAPGCLLQSSRHPDFKSLPRKCRPCIATISKPQHQQIEQEAPIDERVKKPRHKGR